MPKQILSGKPLRDKLLTGIKLLSDTVSTTLGPKGRNVGIQKSWVEPVVLHDGVSVSREIELEDPFENMGAQIVKQASIKTADTCGDGTSTSTLLAYELIQRGFKAVDEGANPMILKQGMEQALIKVTEYITSKSKPIKTKEELISIATISSADSQLGIDIGTAMFKIGENGVLSSEIHAKLDTEVEYKEGMYFDKGFVSSQFVNHQTKEEVEILNPRILITDHTITSGQEVAEFLAKVVKGTGQKEIVIVSSGIDGAALLTLLANQSRGNIFSVAIYAPSFASRRKDILEDIAILTGGIFIPKESITIDKILSENEAGDISGQEKLGRADSVWCDEKTTKIIGGFGDPVKIQARADFIKEQIKNEKSDFEKEKLKERLARLTSGVAVIRIGAKTEIELSDKRERVIDAIAAVKAAVSDGIIAGGGITLLNASKSIVGQYDDPNLDKQKGYKIVIDAITEPIRKLLENAGVNVEKVLIKMNSSKEEDFGYSVVTEEYGNMYKMGIIDPVLVTKETLQNAVSVASAILSMEACVVNIPEKVDKSN